MSTEPTETAGAAPAWHVVHTRPRCEKKLAGFCAREAIAATLVCYQSVHKYRGKTLVFEKPLFPGYVFAQLHGRQRQVILQSRHTANLLEVVDQALFIQQLADIQLALESGLEVRLAPEITGGSRVRIKHGPLRGLEGRVEEREGATRVMLRLDFIGQAASVKIEATDLELA